jgi:hypothetical protein
MLLQANAEASTPGIGFVGSVQVLARSEKHAQGMPQLSQTRVERVMITHSAQADESHKVQPDSE